MRISTIVPTAGDYYPTVRAWMVRLNTSQLDQQAAKIFVTPEEAAFIIERLCPRCHFKIRRMHGSIGRGSARAITLDRHTFERKEMTLGTVLHECAHCLARRRSVSRPQPHGEVFCRTYANLLRTVMTHLLQPGLVIRRSNATGHAALWRIAYVNDCRALVLPLDKTDTLDNRERYGENIAPTSLVEVVTDIERARDELELAAVERELAAARREMEASEVAAVPKAVTTVSKVIPSGKAGGAMWTLAPGEHTYANLKGEVVALLKRGPLSTKEVQAACSGSSAGKGATAGAVAACLDRFWKAGVVIKG